MEQELPKNAGIAAVLKELVDDFPEKKINYFGYIIQPTWAEVRNDAFKESCKLKTSKKSLSFNHFYKCKVYSKDMCPALRELRHDSAEALE